MRPHPVPRVRPGPENRPQSAGWRRQTGARKGPLPPLRGWMVGWAGSQGCATRTAWLALGYGLPPLAGLEKGTIDVPGRELQGQER